MACSTYKIAMIGDGGVGKTVWVKRLINGEFNPKYVPTLGVDVRHLSFNTNYGYVALNMWDTAGQEKYGGLRDGYYVQSDGCIAMFDNTSRLSFKNIPKWISSIRNVEPNIPVVLCGSKMDCVNRKLKSNEKENLARELHCPYYDISAKSNYNFEKPCLDLIRTLSGHPDLEFTESEPILPPKATSPPPILNLVPLSEDDDSD